MRRRSLRTLLGGLAFAALSLAILNCNGKSGPAGASGTNGSNGADAAPVVDAGTMTPEEWAALKPQGRVTSATISGKPVVDFEIRDWRGNLVKGLGNFTSRSSSALLTSYPNFGFALAKLVPEDPVTKDPSKWVSYIVTSTPTVASPTVAPSRPSTDNTGTLVDNGNGTYRYTFYRDITQAQAFLDGYTYTGNNLRADLGDVTYVPTLTHRIAIQFYGAARGTGSNTANGVTVATAVNLENPVNFFYDFIPSAGRAVTASDTQREVVAIQNCNECHQRIEKLGFHGGTRTDTRMCVVCHNDQRKYGHPEATTTSTGYSGSTRKINNMAVGDMPAFIHRLHMGKDLTKTGYDYANVKFNEIGYPMLGGGQRMCSKCHGSAGATQLTLQGDNWKLKPNIKACGACHDGLDFATGLNHGAGVPTNNTQCAGCHSDTAITEKHRTNDVTRHNPDVAPGLVNFTYELASASATSTAVTVKFRILSGVNNAARTPVTFRPAAAGMTAPLEGFTGSPGFLLAYSRTQDGIAIPADYNNLGRGNAQALSVSIANLLDTNKALTSGTMSGPDASGYYTATIVGTNVFPAGSVMRTVALQGSFTQIITSGNVSRPAISVVKTVTGDTARRAVVDPANCSNCHEWFKGHGGSRVYETQVCVMCHNPGMSTSGRGIPDSTLNSWTFSAWDQGILASWGFNQTATNAALAFPVTSNTFKDMIHGIHRGKERTDTFKDVRDRTPSAITIIDGAKIGFPGMLSNCQSCHKYNTFSSVPLTALASTHEANNGSITTPADVKLSLASVPNASDRTTSPFTAACVSCHDSTAAKSHMLINGGQILVTRSTLVSPATESCAVCHGPGATYDPAKVHTLK